METQIQNFNLKQREMFTKLLVQAKTRAEADETKYAVDERVKRELAPKLAEQSGASKLIEKIRQLTEELQDAETALGTLGFKCDSDGDISFQYDAPRRVSKALQTAQRLAQADREKHLKKYDMAVLAVLASEDVQEAKKIVESLL
jgi:hypothetical protein